jgi:glutathione synthase/RimK-type ligase-like ATP-grasp enzyme
MSGKAEVISPIKFIESTLDVVPGRCIAVETNSNHYAGLGYYVALIAEARGYRVFPSADAMFRACPPLANARGLNAIRSVVGYRKAKNIVGHRAHHKGASTGFQLVVLQKAGDPLPPSDTASLRHLAEMGRGVGVTVTVKSTTSYEEIDQADGLFLRCTNSYLFAITAEAIGIPVIDDLHSILRCNNKAFIAERLRAVKLPHPKTILLATATPARSAKIAEKTLGMPLVIKHPSRSHGHGVFKATSRHAIERRLECLSREIPVALAQEFLPSNFDWRIGVLNNAPLYACRYHMAPGYWKIIRHSQHGRAREGKVEAVDLKLVPSEIVTVAVKATEVIGQGFYGVDIKETGAGIMIMEINDNPDLNSGYELAAEGTKVWQHIIDWFVNRAPSPAVPL